MKIKILSWNVRGANNAEKRKLMKAYLRRKKVNLVYFQETKLKEVTCGIIRSLAVGRFVEWVASNAKGASGGILILWDSRVLQLIEVEESSYSLSGKFQNIEDDFTWIFSGVYGPTSNENRELLCEELGAIRGLWGEPWCIGGDFNVIRFPNERNREGRTSSSMRRFSHIIDELELKDVPHQWGVLYVERGPK